MARAPVLAENSRRAQSKAANRQQILDAARAVFAELGYEAASIRDVIRKTDLASGTFYNYFTCKEELRQAIADDSAARFRPLLQKAHDEAESFEDYVRRGFVIYFAFIAQESLAQQNGALAPNFGYRIDTPEMVAVFTEVRAHIEEAIAQGLAPQLDADYFTAAAIGVARELGERMCQRLPLDPLAAAEFATRFVLAGAAAAAIS